MNRYERTAALLCAGLLLIAFNFAHSLSSPPPTEPTEPAAPPAPSESSKRHQTADKPTVAFIGLGAMGYPMAATLARSGFSVIVHNRSPNKADRHAAQFGTRAVQQLTDISADFILTCLPTSADVEQVAEQLIQAGALKPGQTWIDTTSGAPAATQRIARMLEAKAGVQMLDAPVSGGPHGAAEGTLTIMVGGERSTFTAAQGVLNALGPGSKLVGTVGAGHALKAANNALLATHIWAAGEALSMVMKFGVNASDAVSIINAASGYSAATNGIFPDRVLKRDFTKRFGLGLMQKDVQVAVDAANANDLRTPVLSAVAEMWNVAKKEMGLEVDCSEAIKVIERWAGQPIQ